MELVLCHHPKNAYCRTFCNNSRMMQQKIVENCHSQFSFLVRKFFHFSSINKSFSVYILINRNLGYKIEKYFAKTSESKLESSQSLKLVFAKRHSIDDYC